MKDKRHHPLQHSQTCRELHSSKISNNARSHPKTTTTITPQTSQPQQPQPTRTSPPSTTKTSATHTSTPISASSKTNAFYPFTPKAGLLYHSAALQALSNTTTSHEHLTPTSKVPLTQKRTLFAVGRYANALTISMPIVDPEFKLWEPEYRAAAYFDLGAEREWGPEYWVDVRLALEPGERGWMWMHGRPVVRVFGDRGNARVREVVEAVVEDAEREIEGRSDTGIFRVRRRLVLRPHLPRRDSMKTKTTTMYTYPYKAQPTVQPSWPINTGTVSNMLLHDALTTVEMTNAEYEEMHGLAYVLFIRVSFFVYFFFLVVGLRNGRARWGEVGWSCLLCIFVSSIVRAIRPPDLKHDEDHRQSTQIQNSSNNPHPPSTSPPSPQHPHTPHHTHTFLIQKNVEVSKSHRRFHIRPRNLRIIRQRSWVSLAVHEPTSSRTVH